MTEESHVQDKARAMDETTKEEFSVPSWLDMKFVTTALSNLDGKTIDVVSFSVEPASAKGDNYSSSIYRVIAALRDGSRRPLLVKGAPPEGAMLELMQKGNFFETEAFMLTDIIPRIEALLEASAPARWGPLAARCPLHGTQPELQLALQDLREEGFVVAKRRRGLGLRHCLLALRSLARFHAGGHALLRADPSLHARLSNSWRCPNPGLRAMVRSNMEGVARACARWPGFERFAPRLMRFKDVAYDMIAEHNDPSSDGFNVISHGDFWTCNMMFRYDEHGRPCDHRMVDLQLSHVTSPAMDVLYFVSGSPSDDVAQHHQGLLLREYHFALTEALHLLGLEAPSWEQFDASITAHGVSALFFGLCGTPLMRSEIVLDTEATFHGDSSSFDAVTEHPDAKRWLHWIIPEYERRGWLPA